jgi:hypothetical protein
MRAAGSGLAADETIGMSAAGATHQPSRQKPRFLPAAHGVMSAEIARMSAAGALQGRSWQKPRFLPAGGGVMSAEIAPQAPQAPRTNPAGKNHAFCRRRTE